MEIPVLKNEESSSSQPIQSETMAVIDSNKQESQETLEETTPSSPPAAAEITSTASVESVVAPSQEVPTKKEEEHVVAVHFNDSVEVAAAAEQPPRDHFMSDHTKLNLYKFYFRIIQIILSLVTFISVMVLGSSFVFFDRLNFLAFVSILTLLVGVVMILHQKISAVSQIITSFYTALSAASHDTLCLAAVLGFDAVFFIFWFAAAVSVGNFSSILTSNGLCSSSSRDNVFLNVGWWWNCGAAISSSFFAFMVWFTFFPTVIFSGKMMFDKVRARQEQGGAAATATPVAA